MCISYKGILDRTRCTNGVTTQRGVLIIAYTDGESMVKKKYVDINEHVHRSRLKKKKKRKKKRGRKIVKN